MLVVSGVQDISKYCKNTTCLVRTCSRHLVHHPKKWTVRSCKDEWFMWSPLLEGEFNCDMYKGSELLQTLINIPLSWEVEDE